MRQSVKHTLPFLTVLAFLIGLAFLAINGGRAYVTASTDSKQSSATGDSSGSGLALHAGSALDYLKQRGLFDPIKGFCWSESAYRGEETDCLGWRDNEYFGFSVGISGDTIAVGAYFNDVVGKAANTTTVSIK